MRVAWDTETALIRPGLGAPPLVCVSSAHLAGDGDDPKAPLMEGLTHWSNSERLLSRWLNSEHNGLHNAPYDLAVVAQQFPRLLPLVFVALSEDRVYDTMYAQQLIDIAYGVYRSGRDADGRSVIPGYTLDAVSHRYTGHTLDKDTWRLRYAELRNTPLKDWPKGAQQYPVQDAVATWEAWEGQNKFVHERNPDMLVDLPAQLRAHWALHLASVYGLKTDGAAVESLARDVEAVITRLRTKLQDAGLVRPDGSRDMKAAKDRLLKALGDKAKLTDKGTEALHAALKDMGCKRVKFPSDEEYDKAHAKVWPTIVERGWVKLDEEACLASGDEALHDLSTYRSMVTLLSKDVGLLRRGVKTPISARFSLLETGRTSTSPNIQNPPQKVKIDGVVRPIGVRECYVPRQGYVYAGADYDKAELVALAQICIDFFGYSKLGDALNAGRDPHLEMGAKILGVGLDEVMAGGGKKYPGMGDARQLAKAANFGFPGGLGIGSFMAFAKGSYGVEISPAKAMELKATWLEAWPEMGEYFEWASTKCNQGDDGRAFVTQIRSGRLRGQCFYTQTCNTLFQGLTADGAKAAAWEVTRRAFCDSRSALYGCRLVNLMHDELIAEVPGDKIRAHEAAMELAAVMIEEYQPFVPDVRVSAEPVLMRRWAKAAEPVYEEGGILIPWEDRNAA